MSKELEQLFGSDDDCHLTVSCIVDFNAEVVTAYFLGLFCTSTRRYVPVFFIHMETRKWPDVTCVHTHRKEERDTTIPHP